MSDLLLSKRFSGHDIRVVGDSDHPWFVAGDVCSAIGVVNTARAVSKLDADEKGVQVLNTLGGDQEITVISEPGMYKLIMRSHDALKPGTPAHSFTKWVTSEVLPEIRRRGSFGQRIEEGDQFGDLTVMELCEERDRSGHRTCLCRCSCGKTTTLRLTQLRAGGRTNCGHCGEEAGVETEREYLFRLYRLVRDEDVLDSIHERLKTI